MAAPVMWFDTNQATCSCIPQKSAAWPRATEFGRKPWASALLTKTTRNYKHCVNVTSFDVLDKYCACTLWQYRVLILTYHFIIYRFSEFSVTINMSSGPPQKLIRQIAGQSRLSFLMYCRQHSSGKLCVYGTSKSRDRFNFHRKNNCKTVSCRLAQVWQVCHSVKLFHIKDSTTTFHCNIAVITKIGYYQ